MSVVVSNSPAVSMSTAPAGLYSVAIITGSPDEDRHGYRVTKQVKFEIGQTSARIKGALPAPWERHEYLVRAGAGQIVTVGMFSDRETARFSVSGPDGNTIEGAVGLNIWRSELYASGAYHVVLSPDQDPKARYTIDVSVE